VLQSWGNSILAVLSTSITSDSLLASSIDVYDRLAVASTRVSNRGLVE